MKIVALSGGVGGARLVSGLSNTINPKNLTVVVNTGDDFYYWGQHVSPDIDIVMYHLAGIERENPGWGIEGDSFSVLEEMKASKAEHWFQLGDKDLATSIVRSTLLSKKYTLTEATQAIALTFGIQACIFPMADQYVPTIICSKDRSEYAFQDYMVKLQCEPEIEEIVQKNIRQATIPSGLSVKIAEADYIIIGPSNPYVSIGTILNVPDIKEAIISSSARKIAISPIIGGKAIKGPAAKMMKELNLEVSSITVADFYKDIVNYFVLDTADQHLASHISDLGLKTIVCDTVMNGKEGRRRLANHILRELLD